jgi:outer membrane protein assembly factor BamB
VKVAMKKLPLALLCLGLTGTFAAADEARPANWPHWRGPLANGTSADGDPPVTWDEKTNVKWKVALPGRGSSTPIVWGDRLFVLAAVDTGRQAVAADIPRPDPRYKTKTNPPTTYHQFLVLCLDRRTGKELWRRVAAERVPHEGRQPTHTYAAGSPVTDGRFLYVSFGSYGVFCYDLDGKLQWQRELGTMYTRFAWGEASTPALFGDTLVVDWDHEGPSFIVALDARTGKTRWKKDRDEPTGWATPCIVTHQGRTQVIVNGTKRARGYDLATGEVLWECGGQTVNAIPSPLVYDGLAICMSGYTGAAAYAIPLDARGDLTGTDKIAWKHSRGTPYVPSPLLVGDRLYFTSVNDPRLTCLDAKTGKVLMDRQRLPELSSLYASPVAAKGRMYFVGRDGTTLVLRHGDKLEVLAVNRLEQPIDASPVVVGRQLFLRGERCLYCLEAE